MGHMLLCNGSFGSSRHIKWVKCTVPGLLDKEHTRGSRAFALETKLRMTTSVAETTHREAQGRNCMLVCLSRP